MRSEELKNSSFFHEESQIQCNWFNVQRSYSKRYINTYSRQRELSLKKKYRIQRKSWQKHNNMRCRIRGINIMRHRKEMPAEPDSRRSHIPSCLHTCSCDEASEKLLMQMTKIWVCDDVTFTFYGRRRRLNRNVWDRETLAYRYTPPRPKKTVTSSQSKTCWCLYPSYHHKQPVGGEI